MIDDMYGVLQRIDDIKKRFGLTRHNSATAAKTETQSFDNTLKNIIDQNRGYEAGISSDETLSSRDNIDRIADYYAARNKIPSSLVKAVIETESGYDPAAVSPKGAMGLMQLMPSTVKDLGLNNPFSPEENISAGSSVLKRLIDRYGGNYEKALAAYNAGPAVVDGAGGVPEYNETKQYVDRVIKSYLSNK